MKESEIGHPQLPQQLADIMDHPHHKLTMHVALTSQTHHACNHPQLKLTMHATTHNSNSPCM